MPEQEPMYERLIPDPREDFMLNDWDVIDEHPHHVGASDAGYGGGAAVDDDIERAILESMKHHNDNYGGSGNDVEDEILARVLEESKQQAKGKRR